MLPLFEPVLGLYVPVTEAVVGAAALALAGMAVVVALVIRADRRRAGARAGVTPIRSRLREAA